MGNRSERTMQKNKENLLKFGVISKKTGGIFVISGGFEYKVVGSYKFKITDGTLVKFVIRRRNEEYIANNVQEI